jgi:hypothetical protein
MTDLSAFEFKQDTLVVTIKNPGNGDILYNEDKSPMTIELWLPHTAQAKAVDYEYTDKYLASMDKGKKRTAEQLDKQRLERLAKVTKAWNVTLDKKKPDLTVEAATAVYGRLPWLYAQCVEEVAEAVSFTKD